MPIQQQRRGLTRRASLGIIAAAGMTARSAHAAETVRIGLPTKTYWPTIITEAATQQKLFDREGIACESTIYRGGAECFEALAAGAADVILDPPSLVGAGLNKGIKSKLVATASLGYQGWYLMVPPDSAASKPADLEGKKVGITSAGSGSDILALWTQQQFKMNFTRVPLGGGGLVPNLRSHNVDAIVLYSPLSFQMMTAKQARVLIDYNNAVPPNLTAGWIATQEMIDRHPETLQKALNALYGGLAYLRANRQRAIDLIVETDEIPADIAALEYDNTTLKLSTDATIKLAEVERSLQLSRLGGMTDMAPADQLFINRFKPVPTE
jgi:ABC-type nitrate/sulfonate/bicarbonate transport system substrate-binding protein